MHVHLFSNYGGSNVTTYSQETFCFHYLPLILRCGILIYDVFVHLLIVPAMFPFPQIRGLYVGFNGRIIHTFINFSVFFADLASNLVSRIFIDSQAYTFLAPTFPDNSVSEWDKKHFDKKTASAH